MSEKRNLLISVSVRHEESLLKLLSGVRILAMRHLESLVGGSDVVYLMVEADGMRPGILDNLTFPVKVSHA